MLEEIEKSLNELKAGEKKNFTQSIDLIISLKGIDLKKSENKFSEDVLLPHGRGRDAKVAIFSDNLSNLDCDVFTSSDIQKFTNNKREARKMVAGADFLLSEALLMPAIGKSMGQILAPKGKMPKVIVGDVRKLIENYKKSVRVAIKNAPVIQCFVGKEDVDNKKIAENVEAILKFLETKLPRGRQNIGKVLLKLTMSKPVKVEVK